jgi:hypothetical protein
MIDTDARNSLAAGLQQLVRGEITNDEFDDHYYRLWHDSGDQAVTAIAAFGWSLYSSGLLVPYALAGRHVVSEEAMRISERAFLFLKTDLEYEWPALVPGPTQYWTFWGPGCYLGLGVVLLLAALGISGISALYLAFLGLINILPTFHWLFTYPNRVSALERFRASGEYSVWPFLRPSDYESALATKGRLPSCENSIER